MDFKKYLPDFIKIAFNAIEHFAEKAAWEGYFVQLQEKYPAIKPEEAKNIASITYKQSPLKILPLIRELLQNYSYSEEIINGYISNYCNLIRDYHPIIYLCFNLETIEERIKGFDNNSIKITEDLEKIKQSPVFRIFYYSIDEYDHYLQQASSNDYTGTAGLDLFDFKDDEFSGLFAKTFSNQNNGPILICGEYQRETLLAVLCELKKLYPNDYLSRVYIFNNESDYLNALKVSLPEDSILINSFFTNNSIPFIQRYINIHIVSKWKYQSVDLRLKPRLLQSTQKALERNGFIHEEIARILRKCKNSFPHIFRELIKETDNLEAAYKRVLGDTIITTSLLINRFSLSYDTDKEIVSALSGIAISEFEERVLSNQLDENPFAKKVVNYSYIDLMVLNFEGCFGSFYNSLKQGIVIKFFECAKKILCNLSKEYHVDNYIKTIESGEYSKSIINSVFETLLFFTVRNKFKKQCLDVVKTFFEWVYENDTIGHYKYLSDYLPIISEIYPSLVCEIICDDVRNRKGLFRLFVESNNSKSILSFGSKYINVLWACERLLFFNNERENTLKVLFQLCLVNTLPENSNTPKVTLKTFFIAWMNTTPTKVDEKISYCKMLFSVNPSKAWDIFIDLLYTGGGETVWPFNAPRYIKYDNYKERCSREDTLKLYNFYNSIILENTNTSDQIVKLLDKHYFVYFGENETNKVIKKVSDIVVGSDDLGKKDILSSIESFIYRNRKFSNAGWAAPESILNKFEELAKTIKFDKPEVEYISLFTAYTINIPNPEPFNHGNYDHDLSNKKVEEYLHSKFLQFIEGGLDINYIYNYFNNYNHYINEHLYEFVKKFEMDFKHKNYFEFVEEITNRLPNLSVIFSNLGNDIYLNHKGLFFEIATSILESKNYDALIRYLYSGKIEEGENSFIKFLDSLPTNVKDIYWKNIGPYISMDFDNLKVVDFVLNNIRSFFRNENRKNPYIITLYYFSLRYTSNDCERLLLEYLSIEPEIIAKSDLEYLPYLLERIQPKYASSSDFKIESQIASLELLVIKTSHRIKPVCLYNILGREALIYFDLINNLYIDKNVSKEYKGRLFSLLHFDIKFCPGYVRDLFDEVVFKKWILDFENAINQSFYDKKKWLMYSTLGTLFQHGRKERDFPLPVAILEYIETISDDECFEYLKNSYCIEAHNSVGIRTISDGADLLSKSNYYKTVSEDLKNKGYLKTACIFEQLSKEFYQTGNVERKRAEDEW